MKHLVRVLTLLLGIVVGASAVFVYQHWQAQRVHKPTMRQAPQSGNQLEEITLERTRCYLSCPPYKVILRSGGTATYIGESVDGNRAERVGTYEGVVSKCDFDRLARLIQEQDYFALKDIYVTGCMDVPNAVTSVVQNGKRKTVTTSNCYPAHYEDAFKHKPQLLYRLEAAIDGIAATIDWQPAK